MPDILAEPKRKAYSEDQEARPLIDLSQFDNSKFSRGASRLKEALWVSVKCICFQMPVPLPSNLRCSLLRLFGANVGRGVVIRSRVNITFPWRLSIGDHSWIGEGVEILSLAPVIIGSHVCISQRAFLCTGSHDFSSSSFDLITEPIRISDHCWIAANTIVCPGVTIEKGAMVGAGVTVTKDVAPGTRLLPIKPAIRS